MAPHKKDGPMILTLYTRKFDSAKVSKTLDRAKLIIARNNPTVIHKKDGPMILTLNTRKFDSAKVS